MAAHEQQTGAQAGGGRPSGDPASPAQEETEGAALGWAALLLQHQRALILQRWLAAAMAQPFHHGRRDRAVSDAMPRLFDALVACLAHAPQGLHPRTPFDDPAVREAAVAHARTRADQGLQPAQVLLEFRLLRHEIRRTLHDQRGAEPSPGTVRDAELLVVDAMDGVIAVGLETFSEQLETAREEFLATMVHEVRHPLTALQGTAQLATRRLGQGALDRARMADALDIIVAEAARLEALLQRLAEASRAALGHLELQLTPVDLAALVRATLAALPPEAAERVSLRVAATGDLSVPGDAPRLQQVVENLLSNALKYAPPPTPVRVTLALEEGSVHLRVQDEGIGIAADEAPLLFQRYRRTDAARAHGIAGSGLGLYLCRAIVTAHGGRIWAESPGPDAGTTVHVLLPQRLPEGNERE